jgi:hypothetical protein
MYLMAFAMLIAALIVSPVAAQGTPPSEECQCKDCHEEQYYLYDSGKWYCLCKAPMTCVHCHGGNGREINADLAHQGMLANPFTNNAAICQNCHMDQSQARVDEFVQRAGVVTMPISVMDQPAFNTAEPQPFPAIAPRVLGVWEWFSVALLGTILVLIFLAWRR